MATTSANVVPEKGKVELSFGNGKICITGDLVKSIAEHRVGITITPDFKGGINFSLLKITQTVTAVPGLFSAKKTKTRQPPATKAAAASNQGTQSGTLNKGSSSQVTKSTKVKVASTRIKGPTSEEAHASAVLRRLDRIGQRYDGNDLESILVHVKSDIAEMVVKPSSDWKEFALRNNLPGYSDSIQNREASMKSISSDANKTFTEAQAGSDAGTCVRQPARTTEIPRDSEGRALSPLSGPPEGEPEKKEKKSSPENENAEIPEQDVKETEDSSSKAEAYDSSILDKARDELEWKIAGTEKRKSQFQGSSGKNFQKLSPTGGRGRRQGRGRGRKSVHGS